MQNQQLFLLFTIFLFPSNSNGLHRDERFLIYPEGTSKAEIIVAMGIPVDLKKEALIMGLAFRASYKVPMNTSFLYSDGVYYGKRMRRSLSRWEIYELLSLESQMRGFEGKPCVLQAICEVAQNPIDKNYGLFNQLFHTIFTPSRTADELNHYSSNEYHAAEIFGKTNKVDCDKIFKCGMSILRMFTFLH